MHRGMWGVSASNSPLLTNNHLGNYNVINTNELTNAAMLTGMSSVGRNNVGNNSYALGSPDSTSMINQTNATSSFVSVSSPYATNNTSQQERPQEVCKFFVNGGCLRGANCPFSHELPDERHLDVHGLGFIFNPNVHNAEKSVAISQSEFSNSQNGHISPTNTTSPINLSVNNQVSVGKTYNYSAKKNYGISNNANSFSSSTNNGFASGNNSNNNNGNNNKNNSNVNSDNNNNVIINSNNINSFISESRNNATVANISNGVTDDVISKESVFANGIGNTSYAASAIAANNKFTVSNTVEHNASSINNSSQSSLPVSVSSGPNLTNNKNTASVFTTNSTKTVVTPYANNIVYNNSFDTKFNNPTTNKNLANFNANANFMPLPFNSTTTIESNNKSYYHSAELNTNNINRNNINNSNIGNVVLLSEAKMAKLLPRPKYKPPEPFLEYNLPPVLAIPLKVPAAEIAHTLTQKILQKEEASLRFGQVDKK